MSPMSIAVFWAVVGSIACVSLVWFVSVMSFRSRRRLYCSARTRELVCVGFELWGVNLNCHSERSEEPMHFRPHGHNTEVIISDYHEIAALQPHLADLRRF